METRPCECKAAPSVVLIGWDILGPDSDLDLGNAPLENANVAASISALPIPLLRAAASTAMASTSAAGKSSLVWLGYRKV